MAEIESRDARRRRRRTYVGGVPALVLFLTTLLTAGCGDFWENPNGTTTTLTASPSPATVGESVTLTATVSQSAATGTVTFYGGSTSLGSETLSSGTATLTTSFTAAGTVSLTASYSGDDTYSPSTSSAVSLTVSSTSSGSAEPDEAAPRSEAVSESQQDTSSALNTTAFEAAPIHATEPFSASDRTFTAQNAEAAVVENAGSVTLTGVTLKGAAGNGRGVLLFRSSSNSDIEPSFTATGGSITYTCNAAATKACSAGSTAKGQNAPATLFAVANTKATIALTDVEVTNETTSPANSVGTLLTAAALGPWGTAGQNGGEVTFHIEGTALKGNVVVDGASTAAISLLADEAGTGSTLKGAINGANSGQAVSLTLDSASAWTLTGTSYVTSLDGLALSGKRVNNIHGGGHCIYYSSEVNGTSSGETYQLNGGGYLAPKGTTGLACE
jgi:hypothetical protein